MPDITYTDSHVITVGKVSLELYYLGLSYGNCLSVMIARPANIMMVANIINPPAAALPWDPTLANYYIHKLVPFLKSLEVLAVEQGVERVVGAFGAIVNAPNGGRQLAPSTASISMISDQRVFWELLIAAVKTEFDAGSPARVIPKRVDMKQFSNYAGYDERNLEIMMRRVYSLHRIGR